MPTINPEILRWARETAGLTPSRAAYALGIKDTKKVRAVDRISALESGEQQPSRPLLLRMTQKYRRPLLTFYLEAPPKRADRGEDFRSIPDRQTGSESLVDALVRDVRARQSTVRDILLDDEDHQTLKFVGSSSMYDGAGVVLDAIRSVLRLDISEYRAQKTPEIAFNLLRSRVEAAGIFVLLIGNLGSHHTAINVEAFRGFALADDVAPFIIINDQDAVTAWSFTLVHELAHLWLGKTGVSGRSPDLQIEKFCNDVAAAFFLPEDELSEVGVTQNTTSEKTRDRIEAFASARHISRSMVAYSLYRADLISDATWKTLSAWFLAQWRKGRDARRERQKDAQGGPNYYTVRRHRLGTALMQLVARSINGGTLTPTRASKILGVKPRSVAPLLNPSSSMGGRAA